VAALKVEGTRIRIEVRKRNNSLKNDSSNQTDTKQDLQILENFSIVTE
jgi:hypothetical protein